MICPTSGERCVSLEIVLGGELNDENPIMTVSEAIKTCREQTEDKKVGLGFKCGIADLALRSSDVDCGVIYA